MLEMKHWILFLTFFSGYLFAESIAYSGCNYSNEFYSYKAAKQAENEGFIEDALGIYCTLAFRGDYRAQYQMALFYENGVDELIESNVEVAYLWATLSNKAVHSKKRQDTIDRLENTLRAQSDFNREKQMLLTRAIAQLSLIIPTGRRIDMKYEPIDLRKAMEEKNKKREYTGSRIKRDKPPGFLSIVNF